MNTMKNSMKLIWWKLEKFFKGGSTIAQVQVPYGFPKDKWQCALEYFGENTNGGHCYGYQIYKKRLKNKHKTLRVFKLPIEDF